MLLAGWCTIKLKAYSVSHQCSEWGMWKQESNRWRWTMELKGIKASRMDISEIVKVPNSLAQQQRKDAAHSVEVLPPRNNVHCKLSPSLPLCVEDAYRQRQTKMTTENMRFWPLYTVPLFGSHHHHSPSHPSL